MGNANGHLFVVMAGIGFDAMLLDSTGEPLKKRLGWLAYAVSALRHLRARPVRATLRADGGRVLRRRASGIIVGNVGALQGGLALLPGAEPDDGALDLMVLTARGWSGWLALVIDVMLRRTRTGRVAHSEFRELRVQLDRPQLWELDGEVMGETRSWWSWCSRASSWSGCRASVRCSAPLARVMRQRPAARSPVSALPARPPCRAGGQTLPVAPPPAWDPFLKETPALPWIEIRTGPPVNGRPSLG